jgi:hypothetical protein
MNEQRVEEECVPRFHFDMQQSLGAGFVARVDAMVSFVDDAIVGVSVQVQSTGLVRTGLHEQTTVLTVDLLHGRPTRNDLVRLQVGKAQVKNEIQARRAKKQRK